MDPLGRFFGPGGVLASAHPAFEHRPGQERMAQAVHEVIDSGGILMVEAGTGTGKTLAYLVPALSAGRRVIVSTGTRNLQDQIFDQDLPFLRERAGLKVSACMMKGRDNYLCRYRMGQVEREPLLEDPAEGGWVDRLAAWGAKTATGDRAEIADLPDRLRLWRDVNARADTCGGSRCPEYESCWLTRLKRRAQEAQLVVVNHHLFFADLALRTAFGAVLPDYDTVIFDEAHLLEEIATLYFGVSASSAQLDELARDAEKLALAAGGPSRSGGGSAELRQATLEFFLPLRGRLRDETGSARFAPVEAGGPDLEAEWATLSEALDEVVRRAPLDAGDGVDSVPRRAEELREALTRILDRRAPDFVYGMELRGRSSVRVSASPIDVSDLLRERLFDELRTSVLTSATLSVERKFTFFAERLGLDETVGLVVDSPFDYESQALLYLPPGIPEPRAHGFREAMFDEIVRLLRLSGGRAFLLFTSYGNLHYVQRRLAELDGWPLFVQGEGSKAKLTEAFRETDGAVLLGTASFWHGVDVPGPALSLVVVDKLPFDVPSDPLVAARIERIRLQGGKPFMEYQVPLAVLELKQGLGRLLRRGTDRGVVCVLDPRITTRRYGGTFLRSLPPYRVVQDRAECARFFGAVDG